MKTKHKFIFILFTNYESLYFKQFLKGNNVTRLYKPRPKWTHLCLKRLGIKGYQTSDDITDIS